MTAPFPAEHNQQEYEEQPTFNLIISEIWVFKRDKKITQMI